MPNKNDTCISKIKQLGHEIIKVVLELDENMSKIEYLQSTKTPLSWDELQKRLFPNAIDQMCPRIFLGIDEWKCTCECAQCRKKSVPDSVLQTLSYFNINNPFM